MNSTRSSVPLVKNENDSELQVKQHATDSRWNSGEEKEFMGVLDVHVHQARDIQNICIYHKQDVYAKLCLTSDPENTVSSKIINGGGKNPVFNDNLQINVRTIDTSLKCEIYMMSRAKNYLADQLLGFALVPLLEVLANDGKLEKEHSLSSTDLFHSPAGFVQLSVSYTGASPVAVVPPKPKEFFLSMNRAVADLEIQQTLPNVLDKIEFPDPNIANENEMMVSEYFQIQRAHLPSPTSSSVNQDQPFSVPVSSCSEFADAPVAAEQPSIEESDSTAHMEENSAQTDEISSKLLINVNMEAESGVVQQEIVEMYMKGMQEFTESLAKMTLPMDINGGPPSSGSSSSDKKLQRSKSAGSRVFYGSRAFF